MDTELNKIDQSILKSRNKSKTLTVRNLVGVPASFLLTSIVMSGIAIATSGILPHIMWSLSLVLVAVSLCFTYSNLSRVEFFSGIIDLSTLMEQALDRHTMKMKPVVGLEIWGAPLEIQHGETLEVHYDVSLKQGTIAKNTRVRFAATGELDFPEEKEVERFGFDKEEQNMRDPKSFWQDIGNVNPKEYIGEEFKVKVPDQLGEYTMSYWVQCDEYTGNETTFKINVI